MAIIEYQNILFSDRFFAKISAILSKITKKIIGIARFIIIYLLLNNLFFQ